MFSVSGLTFLFWVQNIKLQKQRVTTRSTKREYACVLTGIRQVQVRPAGGQHSGVDARNHVGLIHDEVHDVVICGQLPLRATGAQIQDVKRDAEPDGVQEMLHRPIRAQSRPTLLMLEYPFRSLTPTSLNRENGQNHADDQEHVHHLN